MKKSWKLLPIGIICAGLFTLACEVSSQNPTPFRGYNPTPKRLDVAPVAYPDVVVEDITYRLNRKGPSYWWYAYKFSVRNTTDVPQKFWYKAQFLDKDGFEIALDNSTGNLIGPRQVDTISSEYVIDAHLAPTLSKVMVELGRQTW